MGPPDHAVLRDRVGKSGIVLLPVEVESWNVKSRAARHGPADGTSAKNLPAWCKNVNFMHSNANELHARTGDIQTATGTGKQGRVHSGRPGGLFFGRGFSRLRGRGVVLPPACALVGRVGCGHRAVRFVCAVIRVSRCEAENRAQGRRMQTRPRIACLVSRLPPVFLNQFWGANFLHPVCKLTRRVEQLSFRQV